MKPRRISCSMLPAFNGPLCDAVTERHDSALLLEAVERAGLFLEAVLLI
jgi:ATP/maltotriose-dependent transcriptional regulator MalT